MSPSTSTGLISHHSHSGQFCSHAKGTLEEVVQEAIRKGFSTFGLSEHVPRYREQDLYPEEVAKGLAHLGTTFEAYVVEARRLKTLYASQITLLLGVETEFINDEGLDSLVALLDRHQDSIQYVVGSVHHCHESPIDFDQAQFDSLLSSFSGESEQERFSSLFCSYFDSQYALMRRLKPEVIGHFDLCRLYYPKLDFRSFPEVWEKVERNIKYAVSIGALFELNASAFRKGWNTGYPGVEVFDAILQFKGRFTLSDDSHGPLAVGLHYDRAFEYLAERKVEALWYLAEASAEAEGCSRGVVPKVVRGKPWLDSWPLRLASLK